MRFVTILLSGGLSNQLFQVGVLYYLKEKYGYEPYIDTKLIQSSVYDHSLSLYFGTYIHTVQIGTRNTYSWTTVNEKEMETYDFNSNTSNIILKGYFQSSKYLPYKETLITL